MDNLLKSVFDLPDVSFIENDTLDAMMQRLVANYEKRYKEVTGKTVSLGAADPARIQLYAVALDLFSPSIRQNYVSGQTRGPDAEKTFLNHQLIYKALERRDVHLASHAVCHSLELWSHWIEQRERELETSHASM